MMAPNGQRIDKEKRVNALLTFSANARASLSPLPSETVSSRLAKQLQEHINAFPSNLSSSANLKYQDLDTEGLTLWNLCTRLMRGNDYPSGPDQTEAILAARVFAFLLLDAGQTKVNGTLRNVTRLMRVALKASKSCIDAKRFDLAFKVLEKAAQYEEQLHKAKTNIDITPDEAQTHSRLRSEYFAIRTALAWRQDQFEVAELMFKKAALREQDLDPDTAESLADLLFEIGKDLLRKKQYEMAVKWLERAHNVLTAQELEKLSTDATDLRTSIIQNRIQALLGLDREDAFYLANNLVETLENEVGDKLIVLLLRLELLSAPINQIFDVDAYGDIINRMIRTVTLTEGNFKLIMHHIRKLNDKGPSSACNMLDIFLQSRLFQAENEGWIEKALINRLWMSTCQKDGPDVIVSVKKVLDMVGANMNKALGPSATHAAETLLWKRVESNYSQAQYDAAENWCRLAMHKIFEATGDLNKAKIARKLLIIALARNDFTDARDILGQIPESAKDDPLTQFLMFKIALRTEEPELAVTCLEKVYKSTSKDATILYACVLDAQQGGQKMITIAALQMVLQKYEYNAPEGIHMPALLRCTMRLILSELGTDKSRDGLEISSMIDQLCNLFDGASTQAQRLAKQSDAGNKQWTVQELDWFSKNAYNTALKYSAAWNPRQVLSIIYSCVKFIDLYPKDISLQVSEDILLRHLFCDFLAVILLISLARAEDNIEVQLQDYLQLRKLVDSFDSRLQTKLENLEGGPQQDLLKKLAMLLAYDFEAAIRLKAWDSLADVILKAEACKSMKVYEHMSDMLLSAQDQIPVNVVIATLKRIVNEAWGLEKFDIVKLSRYMRCLFRLAMNEGGKIAEGLLVQICGLAQDAEETEKPYPSEELEYIATTAFNHAVDFYCLGEDTACKSWAEKAISIAGFCSDRRALQGLLQEKLVGLRFGGEEG